MKFFFIVLLSAFTFHANSNQITWMTTENPPFNYFEDDKLMGIAVDLLEKTEHKLGIKSDRKNYMKVISARAHYLLEKNDLTNGYFAAERTPKHERLFKWIGPITYKNISVFALQGTPKVKYPKHIFPKEKIGFITKHPASSIMRKKFSLNRNKIFPLTTIKQMFLMLELKKLKFVAFDEELAWHEIKKLGMDPKKFTVVYSIKNEELWYAVNKNVDDATIAKYQKALESIKKDKKFNALLEKKYNTMKVLHYNNSKFAK